MVDDEGHLIYDQVGSGPATVFTGGQAYPGVWKKEKRERRTRFYGENGEEITFERGPIFVEFISSQSRFGFVADAANLPEMPPYEPPAAWLESLLQKTPSLPRLPRRMPLLRPR